MNKLYILILGIFILNGCRNRTGEVSPLSPPTTRIYLKQINLTDSNSLSGKIKLSWQGESVNGYIKGYEIISDTLTCVQSANYINNKPWSFTTKTDSLFLFPLPYGAKFAQISFYARAIDNKDVKDPNPPCLQLPVKNAQPTIKLDRVIGNIKSVTDTVHSVFSISWFADDPDGISNLDSVFVKFNNGNWVGFSKSVTQLTFVPTSADNAVSTNCKILVGSTAKEDTRTIGSLNLNTYNKVYVRSKDISNAFSAVDTVNSFYYKKKNGDVLVVDCFNSPSREERNVLDPILKQTLKKTPSNGADSLNYDVYDINRSSNAYLPINWNITFTEYLKLYKSVFWINDGSTYGGNLAIELGITSIQNYLNAGGKILVSISKLPLDINSPIYEFAPFDSISSKPGQARLSNNSKIIPANINTYDTLKNVGLITGATPGYTKKTANTLFTATYQALSNWSGPNIVAAGSLGNNGKYNQIYFTTDIHRLNGNNQSLRNVIAKIFNQDFK
ncbi:MAG: hypothetical protein SFY32_02495 [Bacteroidota bacterium]|nr:hypothetical protein [Bacteroidota bacterium]